MAPSSRNTPRQPSSGTSIAAGTVAARLPSEPTKTPQPVYCATRSFGYHCVLTFSIAISPAEMPSPVTTRPIASVIGPVARAHSAKPAAATSASTVCTRRAPQTSMASPTGSCAAA